LHVLGVRCEKLLRIAPNGLGGGEKRAVLGRRVRARDLARRDTSAPSDFEHVGLDVRGGVHPGNVTLAERKASFPLLILRRGRSEERRVGKEWRCGWAA